MGSVVFAVEARDGHAIATGHRDVQVVAGAGNDGLLAFPGRKVHVAGFAVGETNADVEMRFDDEGVRPFRAARSFRRCGKRDGARQPRGDGPVEGGDGMCDRRLRSADAGRAGGGENDDAPQRGGG